MEVLVFILLMIEKKGNGNIPILWIKKMKLKEGVNLVTKTKVELGPVLVW